MPIWLISFLAILAALITSLIFLLLIPKRKQPIKSKERKPPKQQVQLTRVERIDPEIPKPIVKEQCEVLEAPNLEEKITDFEGLKCRLVRPINREAYKILLDLEKAVQELGQGHRVLAEISLRAFMKIEKNSAHPNRVLAARRKIAQKRLDFLIIDKRGQPVLAVEYHGSGHYQGNAIYRDAVKRAALQEADLTLLEIYNGDKRETIYQRIIDGLKA